MRVMSVVFLVMIALALSSNEVIAKRKKSESKPQENIQTLAAKQTGTIVELDLASRTIQIDQKKFTLSDKMLVLTSDNHMLHEDALNVGQKIEYWISDKKEYEDKHLPDKSILRIKIMSGYQKEKEDIKS